MKKSKVIFSIVSTVLISSTLLNTNVFADAKKGIRELVMEHEFKISELEEQVRNVSIETTPLSEEMKETLIKEYLYRLEDLLIDGSDADRIKKMNLVNYKLVEKNGENVFQLYFEDDYSWVLDSSKAGSSEPKGRLFAMEFSKKVNNINDFYGVDVKVEFYEHGEQIKVFIK
jgi:hypothetical protein